jgi:hypothetical protein
MTTYDHFLEMTSQPNPQGVGETSARAKWRPKNVGGPFVCMRARGTWAERRFWGSGYAEDSGVTVSRRRI